MSQIHTDALDNENELAMKLTWFGTLSNREERPKRYLHLSAFPCAKCGGPVITGWLATREREISKETEITPLGAVCLCCGDRVELTGPRDGECHFRPVEWESVIKKQPRAAGSQEDTLPQELSQDADNPQ